MDLLFANSPDKSIGRTYRAVFRLDVAQNGTKVAKSKPSRTYRNPIYLARKWKNMLESGEYTSQTDLARKVGVSRVRVNQILRLLKLPSEIQESAIRKGDPLPYGEITERKLRSLLATHQI